MRLTIKNNFELEYEGLPELFFRIYRKRIVALNLLQKYICEKYAID